MMYAISAKIEQNCCKPLCWSCGPLNNVVDGGHPRHIEKIEKMRIIAPHALHIDDADELISLIDGLVQAPPQFNGFFFN